MNAPNIDFRSLEWAAVEEWLADELLDTYRRLSNIHLDERETQQMRGRVSLLNMMLDFRNSPIAANRAAN